MGSAVFPTVRYLGSGVPTVESIGCWVGLGLEGDMLTSRRVHVNEDLPDMLLQVFLFLQRHLSHNISIRLHRRF